MNSEKKENNNGKNKHFLLLLLLLMPLLQSCLHGAESIQLQDLKLKVVDYKGDPLEGGKVTVSYLPVRNDHVKSFRVNTEGVAIIEVDHRFSIDVYSDSGDAIYQEKSAWLSELREPWVQGLKDPEAEVVLVFFPDMKPVDDLIIKRNIGQKVTVTDSDFKTDEWNDVMFFDQSLTPLDYSVENGYTVIGRKYDGDKPNHLGVHDKWAMDIELAIRLPIGSHGHAINKGLRNVQAITRPLTNDIKPSRSIIPIATVLSSLNPPRLDYIVGGEEGTYAFSFRPTVDVRSSEEGERTFNINMYDVVINPSGNSLVPLSTTSQGSSDEKLEVEVMIE